MIPQLARGAALALIGNVAYAGAQWLALVLVARYCNDIQAGHFALAIALSAPAILLANLQLSTLIATDPHATNASRFQSYLAIRLTTTAAGFFVVLSAGAMLSVTSTSLLLVAIVTLSKCVDAVGEPFQATLQRHEHFGAICVIQLTNAVLSLAFFGVGITWSGDLIVAALGWLLASIVTLILVTIPTAMALTGVHWRLGRCRVSTNMHTPWPLLAEALPMGGIATLLSLQANAPQYALQLLIGPAAIGRFAIIAYPFTAAAMVVTAMGQAASPRLATNLSLSRAAAFKDVFKVTVVIGAVIGAGVVGVTMFGGGLFLRLLSHPNSADEYPALLLLSVAGGLRCACSPVGVAATAARLITPQLAVRAVSLLLLVCALKPAIVASPLIGAAAVTATVACVEAIMWFSVSGALISKVTRQCAAFSD